MSECVYYQLRTGFFFFQAEDGIRDIGVTGVQTCALPISARAPGEHVGAAAAVEAVVALAALQGVGPVAAHEHVVEARAPQHLRSEERRGGKECRSRWSPYH